MIQRLLSICMLPVLLGSTQLKITEEDITNNRDYYEVIGATSGEKIEKTLYAEKRVIETHITAVSAVKEALINEGIEPSNIRVLLYYDGLTIADDSPPRMWQSKPHPGTISSPWLDLTKTETISGETKITVRIDATAARLLRDIYSESKGKPNLESFLETNPIRESCYFKMLYRYADIIEVMSMKSASDKVRKIYSCAPEELREPLLTLFQSSEQISMRMAFGGFDYSVYDQLFFHCQDESKKYYSVLYPYLAIKGLQLLGIESHSKPEWWTEVIDRIEPIQKCER